GAREVGASARERVEARDRLDVVVEDVRPLGDDPRERHLLAAEVRSQYLDLAARRELADRADHTNEGGRAEVRKVVALDARRHRVPQSHVPNLLGNAERLDRI